MRALIKLLKMGALLFAASVVTLLAVRAYDSQRGAPLAPWHTYAPHELRACPKISGTNSGDGR